MNETLKVLETRRSCRNFKPDMIKKEELDAILRAGTYAATGMGRQSPIIIAVTDKATRDAISDANRKVAGMPEGTDPFYGAPVILIVLANKAVVTHVYDGSLVMGNLMNAAASLGVDSIWIVPRKNSRRISAVICSKCSASRVTTKASDTARSVMRQHRCRHRLPVRKATFTISRTDTE